MPSFRAVLNILALQEGNRPESVLENARAAIGAAHLVEADNLDIVRGVPRITVRFMVEPSTGAGEDAAAWQAAVNLRHAVEQVARAERLGLTRRVRGRWEPVQQG